MSKRYTYSKTINVPDGAETFSAVEFDSFDEARKAVDKGVHDRRLELKAERQPKATASDIIGLGKKDDGIVPKDATLNPPLDTPPGLNHTTANKQP